MKINFNTNNTFKGLLSIYYPIKTSSRINVSEGKSETIEILELCYYPFKDEPTETAKDISQKIEKQFRKKISNNKHTFERKCYCSGWNTHLPFTENEMRRYLNNDMSDKEKKEFLSKIFDPWESWNFITKQKSRVIWTKDKPSLKSQQYIDFNILS